MIHSRPRSRLGSPRLVRLTAAALFTALAVTGAGAQNILTEAQELPSPRGAPGAEFGASCALSGDLAAVGSPREDVGGSSEAGAVTLYRRDSSGAWVEEQALTEPNLGPGRHFGHSLAMAGSRLIVSALTDGVPTGSVYVYRRVNGNWQLEQALGVDIGDGYGSSVDIAESFCVVGRYVHGPNAAGDAVVYQYQNGSGWSFNALLQPADGMNSDWFGQSVAIDESSTHGERVLVGAPRHLSTRGAAYLYRRDTSGNWSFLHKFLASDGIAGDSYGTALDLEGNRVVVGCRLHDDFFANSGATYVYRFGRTGWQQAKLAPSQIATNDYFGNSIDMDGDTLVVGARGNGAGAAFVFRDRGGEYVEQHLLHPSSSTAALASSCAVSGPRVLLGAPLDDQPTPDAGAAFLYEFSDCFLSTPPWTVATGQTLRFSSGNCPPDEQGFLVLSSIDGSPFFTIVLRQKIDTLGRWDFSATVPSISGLPGSTLGFQVLSLLPGQGLVQSNESFVEFQ